MDLLHDVEGDGNNATRVLSHSHTPDRTIQKEIKLKSGFLKSTTAAKLGLYLWEYSGE